MFGKKKRAPQPRGQGAAAAKQMGLFMELDPEEMMMGMEGNLDDPDLEAELAAITGNKVAAGGKAKPKGKSPLPMEDIARMADECMRDMDDDEDDADLEDDEDLLRLLLLRFQVSLQSPLHHTVFYLVNQYSKLILAEFCSFARFIVLHYTSNIQISYTNDCYPLQTLQTMLAAVKKGRPVDEAEIPPPVATGAPSAASRPAVPQRPAPPVPSPPESSPSDEKEKSVPEIVTPSTNEATKAMLIERQKEYKMAALRAKKEGDLEQARLHFRTSKRFDAVIEALEKGQAIDLSGLPPSPGQGSAPVKEPSSGQNIEVTQPVAAAPAPAAPSAPAAPKDVLEALEQRRAKYMEASNQAKASGDDRKARMHDRIAKQYQSAIRAHKLGKDVNFEELPVPPGFPPIPGQKATGAEQGFVAALVAADKLASTDNEAQSWDESFHTGIDMGPKNKSVLYLLKTSSAKVVYNRLTSNFLSIFVPPAVQQLEFLEGRKKQYMKAALQAKQKNDMEQAKVFLRTAKGFDSMIEAARSGRNVDISTVPSPPGDEDEDFILVHHSDVQLSEKAEQVYTQLAKILKEQYEKCMTHSKQFTHLGNVTETTKFEKMAESCKKSLEVLKLAQSRGLPPPKHHFEERSFHTVRIFPDLSSTDMVIVIVKGMNLPCLLSIFCHQEQPQKHKTAVIKNTNSPEYNQSFTLSINRNHRGFRRVVASKGIKLELLHKGGFLRSDKPIGTALLKLDKLETQSEIREIVEVMDGRKATGGRVEVKVRLREPLSGQDMQTSTERWLVIDQSQVT
uniref:Coiled-coil and C2 domain containing 1B n=1 Tax=Sparus aurata TaxID=8175 RepID=A0A671VG28_SPAAU